MALAYASELTLEQYKLFEALLNPESKTGSPRTVNLMWVLQAILYMLVSGCAWRLLPNDDPPYSTVYYSFRKWRKDGTWKCIHDHLVQWVRVDANRNASPTAASWDSQSVPTAVMVPQAIGYDGGKKIKGHQRLTLVDTLGWLIVVQGVAASVPERAGAKQLLAKLDQERHPSTSSNLGGWRVFWRRFPPLGHRYLSRDFRSGPSTRGCSRIRPAPEALDRRADVWLASLVSSLKHRL
jgi:putative transposase